MLLFESDVL